MKTRLAGIYRLRTVPSLKTNTLTQFTNTNICYN